MSQIISNDRYVPYANGEHYWEETVSSQWSNDKVCEVYCAKCSTYGEKTYETGEIYWPCT